MPNRSTSLIPSLIRADTQSTGYGLAGELPPDIALEEQALNRRQQIADILLQRSMEPRKGEMVGRFYVPSGWAQGLAQLGQAAAGTYITHKIGKDREELAKQNKEATTQAVQAYLDKTRGTPAVPPQEVEAQGPGRAEPQMSSMLVSNDPSDPNVPNSMKYPIQIGEQEGPRPRAMTAGTPAQPATEDQWREAIAGALASQHPALKGLATADAARLNQPAQHIDAGDRILLVKGGQIVGTLPKGVTPETTAKLQGEKDLKSQVSGDAILAQGGQNQRLATTSADQIALPGPDGKPMVNQAVVEAKEKIAAAGKTSVQNVVNMAQEKAFEQELGKEQAKDLIKGRAGAVEASEMLSTINEGRKLLASPMITGFGAEAMVSVGQALKQVGFDVGGDAIANTQAYAANMAQNVGKLIKQFGSGTGLSNADREYAEKMAGGKITLEKDALLKILDIGERASRNVMQSHNKRSEGVKTNIPLKVPEPPRTGGPTAGIVENGYRFKGGDPSKQENWEQVK